MTRDLSPEAVAARLAMLSRLYVPMTLEEALAEERRPRAVDMSPEAVEARLDELSALWQLTWALQAERSG